MLGNIRQYYAILGNIGQYIYKDTCVDRMWGSWLYSVEGCGVNHYICSIYAEIQSIQSINWDLLSSLSFYLNGLIRAVYICWEWYQLIIRLNLVLHLFSQSGWSVRQLVSQLISWSVGWLVSWSVSQLVGWLVDWLVGVGCLLS